MEIREYKNGGFQVWENNKVLRPLTLEWEGSHQWRHSFMFFSSFKQAKKAIINLLLKESSEEVVAIHSVDDKG